ncbi:MAG: hypothetical protein NC350_05215 [Corallococcus sp.]|nr:hypothetical protein [Corallococcus sp.]
MKNIDYPKENLIAVGERKRTYLNIMWIVSAVIIVLIAVFILLQNDEEKVKRIIIAYSIASAVLIASIVTLELLITKQIIAVYTDRVYFFKGKVSVSLTEICFVDVVYVSNIFGKRIPEAVTVMTRDGMHNAVGIKNAVEIKNLIEEACLALTDNASQTKSTTVSGEE